MLFSDGGSSSGRNAAGACVVEDRTRHTRVCLAVYLGAATNNEAESAASLLGFSALRALHGDSTPVSVHWVSDSEYVLKSATAYIRNWQRNGWQTADKKPVKNQGLWRAYLALTHSFKIKAEHVKGHSGHPENEACDQASLWARNFADEFDAGKSWVREDLDTPIGTDCWTCFDGRVLLEGVRSESPSEEQNLELVRLLGEFFRSKDNESDQQAPKPVSLRPVLGILEQAKSAAGRLSSRSPEARDLEIEIDLLLSRFR